MQQYCPTYTMYGLYCLTIAWKYGHIPSTVYMLDNSLEIWSYFSKPFRYFRKYISYFAGFRDTYYSSGNSYYIDLILTNFNM